MVGTHDATKECLIGSLVSWPIESHVSASHTYDPASYPAWLYRSWNTTMYLIVFPSNLDEFWVVGGDTLAQVYYKNSLKDVRGYGGY